MTEAERRRRVEEVCDAALDRAVGERAAFVAAACGDDGDVRREVEALLAHAQEAETFLELPLGDVAAQVLAAEHGESLVGRQVGPHRIVSLLGRGGMGEVYRARDTQLGRDVAIKVVAGAFPSEPARRARFEREARALATLNHPHVGAIYGLVDGGRRPRSRAGAGRGRDAARAPGAGRAADSGGALALARQLAEALEAAHDKGIVHRDLKPANLKITPDGALKVLDFGLAKVFAVDGAPDHPSQAADDATQEGTVVWARPPT